MRAVNLLPPEQRKERRGVKPNKKLFIGAGALALAGGLGFWGYSLGQQASDAQARIDRLNTEQQELSSTLAAYQLAATRASTLEQRQALVAGLAGARVNWAQVISNLATVAPRRVWFTEVKVESPSAGQAPTSGPSAAAGATATPAVHLDGRALTKQQVATLMVRLGAMQGFGDPTLTSIDTDAATDGRTTVHFVIDVPVDQRLQDAVPSTISSTPTSKTP